MPKAAIVDAGATRERAKGRRWRFPSTADHLVDEGDMAGADRGYRTRPPRSNPNKRRCSFQSKGMGPRSRLRRVPVCKNTGNDVGSEEAKAQEPRHIPMGDPFLLCDLSGRPGSTIQ